MEIYPDEVTTFAAVVLYGAPVAVAVLSYLLGCINGAIATSHIFYHDDVRRHGSGNAGLTNFYRNYGAKCAPMVIAFDMLKAVGAVLLGNYFLGYLLGWGAAGKYFGALFCVIGHMFPVFYGFKGGKGVSSTCGVMLMTFWWQALICYVITIALIAITKFVSLGSLALVVLFGIPAGCIIGTLKVLVDRLKEIGKGEEDAETVILLIRIERRCVFCYRFTVFLIILL